LFGRPPLAITRWGSGAIDIKAPPGTGKVAGIQLTDKMPQMMVISQFGKIIRIDTKSVRSAGRATMGVKLLDLDADDKMAAAMVIPHEDPKSPTENGALLL
jgi:DNA gyrase subunit A